MDIKRVLIKTSDDTLILNSLMPARIPRFLQEKSHDFFGKSMFDLALWGKWEPNTNSWKCQRYVHENDTYAVPRGEDPLTLKFVEKVDSRFHGKVNLHDFMSAYDTLLGSVSTPLFAVVDHNSAHHVSLPLVRKAFTGQSGKNLLVINFDAHNDFGGALDKTVVGCQNWAKFLFSYDKREATLLGPECHRYVAIGLRNTANRAYFWTSFSGGGLGIPAPELEPNTADLTDKALKTMLEKLDNTAAYITVDRDFMSGSDTPYGNGDYSAERGRAMVSACLRYLKENHVTLAGFDVTGLPTSSGPEKLNQMKEDIQHFYQEVAAY